MQNVLTLFLISLFPETIFTYILSIRYLLFSVCVFSLTLRKSIKVFRNKDTNRYSFSLLDITYAACIGLTIFSFLFMSQNIKALHYTFVAGGMFCIFLFIRTEKLRYCLVPKSGDTFNSFFTGKLLVHSIIFIAFINALIGLYQFLNNKEITGTFGFSSFFGCYLAINVPIAFGLFLELWKKRKTSNQCSVFGIRFLKLFNLSALVVMIYVIVLTKSRSGIVGLGVVLPLMFYFYHRGTETQRLKSKTTLRLCIFAFLFLLAIPCGHYLYKLKPVSVVGRGLIWQVSADMFLKNPASGVGFGNFASQYNYYQADYLERGGGNPVQKIAASQIQHAYNWYLETAAEFGSFGLIVFGIFWWLVLLEIYKIFKPHKEHKNTEVNYLNIGMAGSVLCFMIMCFFQFPNKIIPTYLMFNFALAWIANANLEENSKTQIIKNQ